MKTFSRSFLAAITTLSDKCENPDQVNQAMRHIMNQTMKLQHSRYVLDLYKELNKKNIGTNAAEHLAKKICYRLVMDSLLNINGPKMLEPSLTWKPVDQVDEN